ncbi:solute carrier family 24 (sodium/potassium/calcium exchanger), member 6 [Paragonimus westermani]|uniref:Solute carrier family 24 (Sodium/potassium/calcium exchanger), member 6 n=1 Tax=Paragonimus westermani TaxID=34504 RepID=A0A5J4NWG5_9TREM|nr:solute carrier family 24 (sodium/potassium/calcium exchanger), member 6 [Paragonimus westermani]
MTSRLQSCSNVPCRSQVRTPQLLVLARVICFCFLWSPSHQIGHFSAPTAEPHGDAPNSSVCRAALGNVTTDLARCEIARTFPGCQFDSGFFPYLIFEYCTFGETVVPTIFMGVTLLAFGNGAPDVFSAVTAITTGDPDAPDEGLGLGFLLGSGLLVNTVTAGLVMISRPFKMSRRPFIKDSIFYIVAVTWSASILIRRKITYGDAIGFLVLYLLYVLLTWGTGTIYRQKMIKEQLYGVNTFWPRPIQRLLTIWNSVISRTGICCHHCISSTCDLRSGICRHIKSSSNGFIQKDELPDVRFNDELQNTAIQPGIDKVKMPAALVANGDVIQPRDVAQDNTKKEDDRISNEIALMPVIEITSPEDTNYANFNNFYGGNSFNLTESQNTMSSMHLPLTTPNLLAPMDQRRQRASSVGSSSVVAGRQYPSIGTPGTGGLSSDRCRRSQSITRRRASTRMSTMGYELPYMVRWIIANREMEEKEADWKRSQRSLQADADGGLGYTDGYPSSHDSRKTSHFASPIRVASPTLSVPSEEDETLDKMVSPSKKITLDLVPKEPQQTDMITIFPKDPQLTELDQIEGIEGTEISWLTSWASKSMWHHLAYYMIPFDVESWVELSVLSKIMQILKIPIFIIFRITIPTVLEELTDDVVEGEQKKTDGTGKSEETQSVETTVDKRRYAENSAPMSLPFAIEINTKVEDEQPQMLDFEAMHGWCKPLNVAQCVIVPTLWPLLLTSDGKLLGLTKIGNSPVPVFVPFTIGGCVIALIVNFTSKWDRPPRFYHRPFFATLGFVTSIVWIYALAHELVNSLEALGIVWEISEAILGLSIMALASSIGVFNHSITDIMSNCLLARNGYPRIAYAACIGSPLFNLLLGAGLSYTIKISRGDDGYATLSFTLTQAVLFSLLLTVLLINIIVALIFKFHFHRIYGIILIIVYLVFVTVAIIIELDLIVSPKNWGLLTGTE